MSRRRTPLSAKEVSKNDHWEFASFPVAYGVSVGLFIGLILAVIPGMFNIFLIIALFAFSFGNAHIFTRWLRTRTLDRRREREEEDEKEKRALAARAAASIASDGSARRRRRRGGKASGF